MLIRTKVKTTVALGAFAIIACAVVFVQPSAGEMTGSTARIIQTTEGDDWWMPSYVKLTPYSGYIAGGKWRQNRMKFKRFQDGHLHFAGHRRVKWSEINPAEDVYDWELLDKVFGDRTTPPTTGIVFYVQSYSSIRTPPDLPDWVVKKGKVKSLQNGAIAAWDPDCEYQRYFGKMIKAIGERYRDHPRLVAVDMRGLDKLYGEWCWRGSAADAQEAEAKTGLTPESFQAWGLQYVKDYLEAFKGQEKKLVWQNSENTFIPPRVTEYDYAPASRAIWQFAYENGCGGRDGMPTVWYRYITDGFGENVTEDGYLEFDDDLAPVKNGAMWYTENTEYWLENETWNKTKDRFGPAEYNKHRWFITTMRVLQMRRNWMNVRQNVIEELEAYDPDFLRWVEFSLGKTPQTSPDAWSWLREGYLARWNDYRPVKNFERWLLQRDMEPDGRTVPAAKLDISMLKYNYASGKGHEFHARRTDRATGNTCMYFRADPHFISGGSHKVILKITYLDGPVTKWCVEYAGKRGIVQSQAVETTESGKWKTVTFEIPDMEFTGALHGGMDFRIILLGQADITVKLVRLIKP